MTIEIQGQPCVEALRANRPEVALTLYREYDDYARWDFEDERPAGVDPYVWTVVAAAVRNGVLYEVEDAMGASWCDAVEAEDPDIHGYLETLVSGAVEALDAEIKRALQVTPNPQLALFSVD